MKNHRASLFTFVLLAFSAQCLAQRPDVNLGQMQQLSPFGSSSPMHGSGSLSGSVHDIHNAPLKDVRIELTDAKGIVANSTYSSSSGSFEFNNIPAGSYTVVATDGLRQVTERVEVSTWNSTVSLRMPANDKPEDGVAGNSISVVQYKIPGKARDEYRKAHDQLERGKLDEAAKHLGKALEICPNYADALTLRAVLELDQQNTTGAIADLDKAVQADGNYAMAYMVMGSALNMQAKYDEAIHALERGEALAPSYWQAHFEMGKAYIGKSDYPSALRHLERAQSMAPAEYALIYLLEAHALLAMKQYPEAMAALQSYLQKDPKGSNSAEAQKMLEKAQAFVARNK